MHEVALLMLVAPWSFSPLQILPIAVAAIRQRTVEHSAFPRCPLGWLSVHLNRIDNTSSRYVPVDQNRTICLEWLAGVLATGRSLFCVDTDSVHNDDQGDKAADIDQRIT